MKKAAVTTTQDVELVGVVEKKDKYETSEEEEEVQYNNKSKNKTKPSEDTFLFFPCILGFKLLGLRGLIGFVIVLTIYHFYLGRILNQFKLDLNKHSHKFYRLINEIPTILLILIVFVVIFKPI